MTVMTVGTQETVLVLLRGNSASGKSSVAAGLRARLGRGLAVVGQDNLRRTVLRERDQPGAANIGLISTVARYALDAGYHVIVEGILYADHYGEMLARLMADHRGATHAYYLHVPFAETLARHADKPQADEYGEAEMRSWYRELDLLAGGVETVIGPDSSLPQSVDRILVDSGLAGAAARDL
ncbi:AAA domain-containing protein [Actinacidiphila bryophytorum]|uniref:AAA domain-containing protein n=2 Tax=Actinacidiphila bryophytorum TaxID=1436133 RepID=A0A9W4H471_9ACTN|nr:AAA domain-containing protein [Actinacidiphila bryophytorum]